MRFTPDKQHPPSKLEVEIDTRLLRIVERYCKIVGFSKDALVQIALEGYLEGIAYAKPVGDDFLKKASERDSLSDSVSDNSNSNGSNRFNPTGVI